MNPMGPNVFDFTDYRAFLRNFYDWKKSKNPSVSYAFICRRTGIKSKGHFALILQGKANVSIPLALRLADFMKLKKRETDYFQNMVLFNQVESHEDKRKYFEKMLSFKESKISTVDKNQYEYFDKWHHAAIRALLEFFDFDGNFANLGEMLVPQISPNKVKNSLQLLKKLSLIKPDKNGFLRPNDAIIDTGPAVQSIAMGNTIFQSLKLAEKAMDRFEQKERIYSGMTLGMSQKGYEEVVQELRDFRKKVYSIIEKDPGERVYQVNLQIFPLSKGKN